MFVAVAHHNTGHGEASSPLIITESIAVAVETARDAEALGYQFYNDETGVAVFRLLRETRHGKEKMRIVEPPNDENIIVFVRTHRNGEWEEAWCNPRVQALYEAEARDISK